MADFHQTGVVTTLHRLGRTEPERLERDLLSYSEERPIALVLPCLHSEVRDVALKGIVETLKRVRYLRQIVVSVSGTSRPGRVRRAPVGLRGCADLKG